MQVMLATGKLSLLKFKSNEHAKVYYVTRQKILFSQNLTYLGLLNLSKIEMVQI